MRFDTPSTRFLRELIKREGPEGRKRIIGLSIEADEVFIYTDSAEWCDDAGAGTFRADSETEAVRAFKRRIRAAKRLTAVQKDADQ